MKDLKNEKSETLNEMFKQLDRIYMSKYFEKKEIMRPYRDIPIALDRLYKDKDYIKERHGKDL